MDPRDHLVQFYADDDELAAAVGCYLADALLRGEVAIAIATPSHRQAFETALTSAGVDVEEAKRTDRMVFLDAADTLARCTVGGEPDPIRFEATVGQLVRRAGSDGSAVRAYGEMVALLWDAGAVNAAIELESMWNDLGSRVPFSLFCAYPADAMTDEVHREAFDHVCRLHSGVMHGVSSAEEREERTFAASAKSPSAARRFVATVLERWGRAELVENAEYVVTELASNAVLHAGSVFVVAVSRSGDGVRIAVSDTSAAAPVLNEHSLARLSGRGLLVVAALARRWGVQPSADGKSVWAELGACP
ncbi:MAG TPA: MEDS domain-containing protein [Acidimicrobiales bacterium]|nr:MEDS domain-containing protein [Acidimicrobiales bacterium]